MLSSKLQWIQTSAGWKPGTPGDRKVSYEPLDDSRIEVILNYTLGGFWISPSSTDPSYHAARFAGDRLSHVPGAPSVPIDVFSLALPAGAELAPGDLRAQVRGEEVCEGSWLLAPAAPPTIEGEPAHLEADPEIYGSDAWYPQTVARCTSPSEVDGLRRTAVTIYPLAFAPRSGRLKLRTHIRLELPCRVAGLTSHPRHPVDWHSPLVRSVVGSAQLVPH